MLNESIILMCCKFVGLKQFENIDKKSEFTKIRVFVGLKTLIHIDKSATRHCRILKS